MSAGAVTKTVKLEVFDDVDGRNGRGWENFFGLGTLPCWDAAAWRPAGVVDAGDVVIIKAVIGRVL